MASVLTFDSNKRTKLIKYKEIPSTIPFKSLIYFSTLHLDRAAEPLSPSHLPGGCCDILPVRNVTKRHMSHRCTSMGRLYDVTELPSRTHIFLLRPHTFHLPPLLQHRALRQHSRCFTHAQVQHHTELEEGCCDDHYARC